MTLGINASQSIENKRTSPTLEAQFSSSTISFQFVLLLNMLIIILFCLCPHECLGSRILIPFSRSVVVSKITCLFFATTFNSFLSISIALHYAFMIACTFVDCYISTCTWIVVLPPQQCSPPLCPSTLFMLPQSASPQLRLPPFFQ